MRLRRTYKGTIEWEAFQDEDRRLQVCHSSRCMKKMHVQQVDARDWKFRRTDRCSCEDVGRRARSHRQHDERQKVGGYRWKRSPKWRGSAMKGLLAKGLPSCYIVS